MGSKIKKIFHFLSKILLRLHKLKKNVLCVIKPARQAVFYKVHF